MGELMEKIMAGKRAERKRIAALPIEQKLAMLEKLRDLTLSIQNSPSSGPHRQKQVLKG